MRGFGRNNPDMSGLLLRFGRFGPNFPDMSELLLRFDRFRRNNPDMSGLLTAPAPAPAPATQCRSASGESAGAVAPTGGATFPASRIARARSTATAVTLRSTVSWSPRNPTTGGPARNAQ